MVKYCPSCGKPVDDQGTFCGYCGTSLAGLSSPTDQQPMANEPQPPGPYAAPPPQWGPSQPPPMPMGAPQQSPFKKGVWGSFAAAGVLFLFAIGNVAAAQNLESGPTFGAILALIAVPFFFVTLLLHLLGIRALWQNYNSTWARIAYKFGWAALITFLVGGILGFLVIPYLIGIILLGAYFIVEGMTFMTTGRSTGKHWISIISSILFIVGGVWFIAFVLAGPLGNTLGAVAVGSLMFFVPAMALSGYIFLKAPSYPLSPPDWPLPRSILAPSAQQYGYAQTGGAMKYCHTCGRTVASQATTCPYCMSAMPQHPTPSSGSPPTGYAPGPQHPQVQSPPSTAPQPAPSAPQQVTAVCWNCGRQLEPGNKYCMACGSVISEA